MKEIKCVAALATLLWVPGCSLIVGTAAVSAVAVVGTAELAGYTVYKGGEAIVTKAESMSKSTTQSVVVSQGTMKAKCQYSVSQLYPAAQQALNRAGFDVVFGQHDAFGGSLRAKTAIKEDVVVTLKKVGKDRTAVHIKIGNGNLKQSEKLYDQMLSLVAENKGVN